jgi:hypothetical protein
MGRIPVKLVAGYPVQLIKLPDAGVPSTGPMNVGVTKVGFVLKTRLPVPVSSVTALDKLKDDGDAKKEATPAPSPETPVEIGSPVQFVRIPAEGVPMFGVIRVGLIFNTRSPCPVIPVGLIVTPSTDNGPLIDVVPLNVAGPLTVKLVNVGPTAKYAKLASSSANGILVPPGTFAKI